MGHEEPSPLGGWVRHGHGGYQYGDRCQRHVALWMIGFAAFTLLMWPLGLRLMNRADESERQRANVAEQAALVLALSEHRFRTLVENAPEAIIVLDVDQQRFVDFNENALRLFAASREEMANLGPVQLSPRVQPDGRDSSVAAQELMARALAGEAPVFEWTHCDLQGNEFICELHLVRLPATGRSLVQASLTDISQRKQEEDKLRQQQAELAHLSRLAVMGETVDEIAHEINQPLFAITNYAHACTRVLSDKNLDLQEVVEWCDDIQREATRAAEIIRRLRGFMRKGDQPRTPVDMNEAVRETIKLLMPDARQHQVILRADLADGRAMISGDLIGMQQVLVNLIRNATEAFQGSKIEHRMVTVTTEIRGRFVEVAVFDNGPGFSDSDVDKIFDTFYSTKTTGLGMGLAISRTLTEAHEGTLTASQGEDDIGAIFRISLPRLEAATQEIAAHSHA
jgi:PAS domain S-box-containing protein